MPRTDDRLFTDAEVPMSSPAFANTVLAAVLL